MNQNKWLILHQRNASCDADLLYKKTVQIDDASAVLEIADTSSSSVSVSTTFKISWYILV